MNETSIQNLARTTGGLRTEAGRLAVLDTALALTLQNAKRLTEKSGRSGDWNSNWLRLWEHAGEILHRLRSLLADMEGFVERGDEDNLRHAMDAWKSIQSRDAEMGMALDAIRSEANGMDAGAREDWSAVDSEITTHLETIHACALALRVKLELMKDYTKKEVNRVLEGMLSKLPSRAQSDTKDAEAYVQQYRQTIHELDEERHEFGGFMDFIKGLAMWVETPDERMKKKRAHDGGRT